MMRGPVCLGLRCRPASIQGASGAGPGSSVGEGFGYWPAGIIALKPNGGQQIMGDIWYNGAVPERMRLFKLKRWEKLVSK